MGSVRLLPQKCRDVAVWAPFGGIFGFPSIHSSCGAVSILCARKSVMVFLRPSRVAHVSARHAHLCRSSAGPTPHDLVSYRTARTAFFEKLFYVFWGVFFGMLLWDLRLGGE